MENSGGNHSLVAEFVLTGFSDTPELHIFLCLVFVFIYLSTLLGNAGILFIVIHYRQFHTPMYFFISNLSLIDLIYSSNIDPKMIAGLFGQRTISYSGCAMQLFFFCALGSTECVLFAVMAYDRYVAICDPLNYVLVMRHNTCVKLAVGAYTSGFLHSLIETCITFRLSYCDSNILHHFVCDFPQLLSISCTDTTINEFVLLVLPSSLTLPCLVVILLSYAYIFHLIFKIITRKGRQKAFSTCASHITAASLYYGTILYVYLSPKSTSPKDNVNMATIFYTLVLPMLNPIIYGLRNKDFKTAIRATFHGRFCHVGCLCGTRAI